MCAGRRTSLSASHARSAMSITVNTTLLFSCFCTSLGVGIVYLSRLIARFNGFGSRQILMRPFFFSSDYEVTHPVGGLVDLGHYTTFVQLLQRVFQLLILCIRNTSGWLNSRRDNWIQLNFVFLLVLTSACEHVCVLFEQPLLGQWSLQ